LPQFNCLGLSCASSPPGLHHSTSYHVNEAAAVIYTHEKYLTSSSSKVTAAMSSYVLVIWLNLSPERTANTTAFSSTDSTRKKVTVSVVASYREQDGLPLHKQLLISTPSKI